MPKPTLVLMVGLPRSGKSTAACVMRQKGGVIVCIDDIRLSVHGQPRYEPIAEPLVWAIAKVMVRSLFLAGHETVVLDATNVTRKRRDEWVDPAWDRMFVLVDTPARICHERACQEGDRDLVAVIARQAAAFEAVQPDEGACILWSASS